MSIYSQVRSLLHAWIPLFIVEIGYALSEVDEHLSIEKPNARHYINLACKFLAKFNYILIFRLIFFRQDLFTIMLNNISSTASSLEKHSAKTSTRFVTNLPYITIGLIFFMKIVLYVIQLVKDFIPDQQNPTIFSETFYKSFIQRFRTRFYMDISTTSTYTTLDYIFGFYEVGLEKISEMIWRICDTLISGIIPLTFTIPINKFEEVLHKMDSENDTSVLTVCCLIDDLKNMSKYINSNWGMICLIWTFHWFTTHAFNLNIWSSSGNYIVVLLLANYFVTFAFFLYFSGEVHSKVI